MGSRNKEQRKGNMNTESEGILPLLSFLEGNFEEINFFPVFCGLVPASFPVAQKMIATFIGYFMPRAFK